MTYFLVKKKHIWPTILCDTFGTQKFWNLLHLAYLFVYLLVDKQHILLTLWKEIWQTLLGLRVGNTVVKAPPETKLFFFSLPSMRQN